VDHPESFNRVDTTPFAVMASHGVSIVHEIAWSRARSCWAPREASRELENQIATASAAAARRKEKTFAYDGGILTRRNLGRRLALRWSDVGGRRKAAGWRLERTTPKSKLFGNG
jgi:hypothetical protein